MGEVNKFLEDPSLPEQDLQQNSQKMYDQYGNEPVGYHPVIPPQEKTGFSTASMVLGICGFIAWLLPLIGYPVTIVGIVLGAVGVRKGGKKRAIAGIICSGITLVLTILNSAAGVAIMMNAI